MKKFMKLCTVATISSYIGANIGIAFYQLEKTKSQRASKPEFKKTPDLKADLRARQYALNKVVSRMMNGYYDAETSYEQMKADYEFAIMEAKFNEQ
jgi:hypothetical protein